MTARDDFMLEDIGDPLVVIQMVVMCDEIDRLRNLVEALQKSPVRE